MRFSLLGSFEVLDGEGRRVEIKGSRPKQLLTILLLHPNQRQSVTQLGAALWGGQEPRAARESIQYFIHQIRRSLSPPAGGEVLTTISGGYQLNVDLEQIDVHRFYRLIDTARDAHAKGDHPAAIDRFQEALELWHGQALVDFADQPFAKPHIARLEELRLVARETQLQLEVARGAHAGLVGELEGLVREHPLRERLRAVLMTALYRSGRQAEALNAYQAGRAMLVDQMGIEPGAELQRLERQILAQDPALAAPGPPAGIASLRPQATPAPPSSPPTPAPARPDRQREERKTVTVLVTGILPGASHDPEDVRDRAAAALSQISERIHHYGGFVQAAAMSRLLAVFGADRSHEDDPERAVRAALDMTGSVAVPEDGMVRVGIATGEVVATITDPGDAPSDDARSVAVVGDVLGAAIALEAGAEPGTVLVGSGTYWATRRAIDYRPVQSASALEQLTGIQTWQAVTPRARTGATVEDLLRAPLVERDAELALLDDMLHRFLRDQAPQMVTLVSEPGLGKSRLVAELGRMVDQAPELITWRVGRCLPYGTATLWALAEIVKAHAGILDTDPAEVADDQLRRVVTHTLDDDAADPSTSQVVDQLRALLVPAPTASAQDRTSDLFAGWSRFFAAAAAERPMVMVIEDLQWADETLLEFLHDLPEQVGLVPLLVVCTTRPDLLDRHPGWSGGKPNAATMSLSPLSPDGTGRLLDVLLGALRLPAATRAGLVAASGGNPLYVEEYVRMLGDRDVELTGTGGMLPMPETVQQLIAARIDTLEVDDKFLLQDAAVIGDTGWVGALAAVSGWDRPRVEAGLGRLQHRQLVRRVRAASVAGETEYTFRHALVRDVVYQQVLRDPRADKHQRAAAWIASLSPDTDERVELLAHHYRQALQLTRASTPPSAELTERARLAFRAAGDRATTLGSLAAAARAYQAALELWATDDPARPELLLRLGQAQMFSAHTGEDILTEARAAALEASRADLATEADALRSQLARIRNDWAAGERHTQPWLDGRTGSPRPTHSTVTALGSQAIQLVVADRHAEAIAVAHQVVAVAQQLGLAGYEGHGLHVAGEARILSGDLDGGLPEATAGLQLMEQHQFPMRLYAHYAHAHALWWYGDLERCAAAVAAGRQTAETVDAAMALWFDALQAGVDYAAGRLDAASAAASRVLTHPPGGLVAPWCAFVRGSISLARGDLDAAFADARTTRELAAEAGTTRYRQVALALSGRVLLAAGRRAEAIDCTEELLADQRRRPAQSCATMNQAMLLTDLDYSPDTLPDGLPPTRWHRTIRAVVMRDFTGALAQAETMGAPMVAAAVRLLLASEHATAGRRAAAVATQGKATATLHAAGLTIPEHRRIPDG